MEKVLIIRSAPFANMAYAVKSLVKDYGSLKITALAQPDVASVLDDHIGIDDFILYRSKFLKIYHLIFLLPQVLKGKFDSIVIFYNNEARKGYKHPELFCLLTMIPYIILCNENGSRDVMRRGKFLRKVLLSGILRIISNGFAFVMLVFTAVTIAFAGLFVKRIKFFK